MLKVSLVALLVAVGATPKKKKTPVPSPAPPAQVEPAKPSVEPEPVPVQAGPVQAVPAEAVPVEAAPAEAVAAPSPATEPSKPKEASAVETTKPKLVVLEVAAGGGIDPTVAAALGDAITLEIQKRGFFTPTSMKELQTMLGVERQRQLLGCSDASSSCLAELADAIGARFVLSGSLTRLGDAYQLSLQTIDTLKAQPLGRSVRIAREASTLIDQVPYAVAEATATALPAPPSKVLPLALIISGGVFVLGGGVILLDAVTRDRAIEQELESALLNPNLLRSMASYRTDATDIQGKKVASALALTLGAALVIGGVLFWPSSSSGTQVALVPTGSGAAVVGVFP